jgi:hypothetical protein
MSSDFLENVRAAGPTDGYTRIVRVANASEIGSAIAVAELPAAAESYRNVLLRLTTTNVLYYLNAAGDDWDALGSATPSATAMDAATAVPEPAADVTARGILDSGTVGESVAFGNLLYLKSDGKWWKSDADAAATMPGLRMALQAKNADEACLLLAFGKARNDAWSWTIGGILYASTDAGALTQTAPSGSGDQVQAVGVAYHADKMIFCPSLVLVEIA